MFVVRHHVFKIIVTVRVNDHDRKLSFSASSIRYLFVFIAQQLPTAVARLSHRNSVCLFVRPSYGWISQKQCKLGSPHFYSRLPRKL